MTQFSGHLRALGFALPMCLLSLEAFAQHSQGAAADSSAFAAADDVESGGTEPAAPAEGADSSASTDVASPSEGAAAEEGLPRRFVLELNPIAIGIGRYSVQAQFLLAGHHALVVNPYFAYTTATVTFGDAESKEKFAGGGLELGYRFYSNPRKPAGFFVGPSVIGGVFHASSGDSANGGSA